MNSILPLIQTLDSLFPIGAYTLSFGMETYTQKGIVYDKKSLESFLKAQLYLLPYNDLGFAAKAAGGIDFAILDEVCSASKQPYETRIGSQKLCSRYLKMQMLLADYPCLTAYNEAIFNGICDGHYSVAVGLFVRDLGIEIREAMELYCYNILSGMVNHAVKLVPLSQMDGQRVLFKIMKDIAEASNMALSISIDKLGVSGCGFDLRSMQHETLPGRLYIS